MLARSRRVGFHLRFCIDIDTRSFFGNHCRSLQLVIQRSHKSIAGWLSAGLGVFGGLIARNCCASLSWLVIYILPETCHFLFPTYCDQLGFPHYLDGVGGGYGSWSCRAAVN